MVSCGPAGIGYENDGEQMLRYARKFSLSKKENLYRLQLSDGRSYWISDDSGSWPSAGKDSIIRIPVRKLVCSTTTQLPWFTSVGATALVAGFPNTDLVFDLGMRQRIDANLIMDVSGPASFNDERMILLAPELILADQSIRVSDRLTQRYPIFVTSESTEPHPLGRAEWIKLGGLLAGRYEEADSMFREVERRYRSIVADTVGSAKGPVVITGVPYGGTWFLPGGGSFMSRLLQDAGFRLSWPADGDETQRPTALEQVMAGAGNITHWIGAGSYRTIDELLASDSRLGAIAAVRSGNVFTFMPLDSSVRGNPYFEEAVIRPDLLLEDLVKIRKGEAGEMHYFRRLPFK